MSFGGPLRSVLRFFLMECLLLTEPTDVSKEDTQNSLSLQDSTDPSLGAGHNQEEGTGRCGLELSVTLRAVRHAFINTSCPACPCCYTSDSVLLFSLNLCVLMKLM